MTNSIKYHERIKDEKHVFLFAVSGRSSSTAFQRIINSSNEVWMWGEPHGLLKKIYSLIINTKICMGNEHVKSALNTMYHSYVENKHLSFYPNAVGNLDSTVELLNSLISNFLKPWAPKVKRFGFKDIDNIPVDLLEYLNIIYQNSTFIFCFRDPLLQWPSIQKLNLEVSKDLEFFLVEYHNIATNYMEFSKNHNIKAFVENNDLRDLDKIYHIIKYLNISQIDESLIDVTVHTIKEKKNLSQAETDIILKSPAYQSYLKMKEISKSFY